MTGAVNEFDIIRLAWYQNLWQAWQVNELAYDINFRWSNVKSVCVVCVLLVCDVQVIVANPLLLNKPTSLCLIYMYKFKRPYSYMCSFGDTTWPERCTFPFNSSSVNYMWNMGTHLITITQNYASVPPPPPPPPPPVTQGS